LRYEDGALWRAARDAGLLEKCRRANNGPREKIYPLAAYIMKIRPYENASEQRPANCGAGGLMVISKPMKN